HRASARDAAGDARSGDREVARQAEAGAASQARLRESPSSASAARLPERLVTPPSCVRRTCCDEQEIGEPVQVGEHERVHSRLALGDEGVALGAAADGPRYVKASRRLSPAREHEALQRRKVRIELVAERFEPVDRILLDPQPVGDPERNAEVGADVEELVLDPLERPPQAVREIGDREDEADRRVQLVHGAERPDPAVELPHPRAVAERRLAAVAGPRVDPRQPHRLVTPPRAQDALRKTGTESAPMRAPEDGIVVCSGWWVTAPTRVGTRARVYPEDIVSAPPAIAP